MSGGRPDFTPLQDKDPDQPKSLGEKVLNAIPIIMTVLATLLAGLSSSEMTQAQYHRSLAAQYQSKAGDQWNFFQAKRQRGAIVAGQLDFLRAQAVGDAAADSPAGADRLGQDLQRIGRRATELLAAAAEGRGNGEAVGALREAAAELLNQATRQADHVGRAFAEKLSQTLPADYRAELQSGRFDDPRPALREELRAVHADLPAALEAIDKRKPEAEIAATLAGITAAQLGQAIDHLETRAAELDKATEDTVRRFGDADKLATDVVGRLRPLHAAVRAAERAADDLPTGTNPDGLRQAATAALRAARGVATAAAELVRAVQLARHEYNERRYEVEARYNQVIAGLYEAQVRKSSLVSDKHLRRSYLFFYAMLAAQGGVTLATFALAVRQMSALWGLASFVGLASMVAGIYVYLFI